MTNQYLDRLRVRHLRLILLIERHKSLRSIAEVLNVSQPALSQMVKDLETAFGTQLVARSARGVTLTPAGRLALERAQAGVATVDHLAHELRRDQTPVLRIGTNPALLIHTLPDALRRLNAGPAPLRFHIRASMESVMRSALLDGKLDCYLGVVDWTADQPRNSDVLRHEPMRRTSDLALVCSSRHPLAGRKDLSARALLDHHWAFQQVGSNNRSRLETAFRRLGLTPPTPAVEMEADPNAFMLLAEAVDLIVCVPTMTIGPHVESRALVQLQVPDLQFDRQSLDFVTLSQNSETGPVRLLRKALSESFATLG